VSRKKPQKVLKHYLFSPTTNIQKRDREIFLCHITALETVKLLADELTHKFLTSMKATE